MGNGGEACFGGGVEDDTLINYSLKSHVHYWQWDIVVQQNIK